MVERLHDLLHGRVREAISTVCAGGSSGGVDRHVTPWRQWAADDVGSPHAGRRTLRAGGTRDACRLETITRCAGAGAPAPVGAQGAQIASAPAGTGSRESRPGDRSVARRVGSVVRRTGSTRELAPCFCDRREDGPAATIVVQRAAHLRRRARGAGRGAPGSIIDGAAAFAAVVRSIRVPIRYALELRFMGRSARGCPCSILALPPGRAGASGTASARLYRPPRSAGTFARAERHCGPRAR